MLLNLDAGESPDEPEALWALADVLCCACGGHAGDLQTMARVAAFVAHSSDRSKLGAHPGYPDLANFGRVSMDMQPGSITMSVARQCQTLGSVASAHGVPITYLKPHGALYHDAARDPQIAAAIVRGAWKALGHTAVIVGPPTGALRDAAQAEGLPYLREGFADRAVRADGSLVPRGEPGALITDPAACAARARELRGQVDTLCVHGDTPKALEIATAVRAVLDGT